MPAYEYQCASGHRTVEYRSVLDRGRDALCHCGLTARKGIFTPPRVFGDFPGYESPATGRWIEGRRARVEDLKRSGCRPYEEGEREDAKRRAQQAEIETDARIDEAVERTLNELTL